MTQTMHCEETSPYISAPAPEVAALSDEEFAEHLYAQGIRYGETRPASRPMTERQQRRAQRQLGKLIRRAQQREIRNALRRR